ncbi:MAG TPA: hypothetical protein VNE42_02040 [Acidimicrobiales bacterium]|nr:hypothetical protein [Acidimicrobiales bacterium]
MDRVVRELLRRCLHASSNVIADQREPRSLTRTRRRFFGQHERHRVLAVHPNGAGACGLERGQLIRLRTGQNGCDHVGLACPTLNLANHVSAAGTPCSLADCPAAGIATAAGKSCRSHDPLQHFRVGRTDHLGLIFLVVMELHAR